MECYSYIVMAMYRLSAVEIMGIPLDEPQEISGGGAPAILRLMSLYSIEPELVKPMGPQDITPWYWEPPEHPYKYFVSSGKTGVVEIDLMPATDDAVSIEFRRRRAGLVAKRALDMSYRLPYDGESFVLAGSSPRYVGQACLHEAFLNLHSQVPGYEMGSEQA